MLILSQVTRLARRRAFKILALPFVAITFLIGWALYAVGSAQHDSKKPSPHKPTVRKQVDLEMGLLAEVEEEQRVSAKN
jgi:hypothetical protein